MNNSWNWKAAPGAGVHLRTPGTGIDPGFGRGLNGAPDGWTWGGQGGRSLVKMPGLEPISEDPYDVQQEWLRQRAEQQQMGMFRGSPQALRPVGAGRVGQQGGYQRGQQGYGAHIQRWLGSGLGR